MTRTVVCHFYNEEFLLPWWLKHHRAIFDHGIMINYGSTDRSCDLIKELCPTWEIRPTRNEFFDSIPIDLEVMDIERELSGWRMCLNVTEFLYGNLDHLTDTQDPTQYLIGNYVFVDMQDDTKGPIDLDHNIPIHQQRTWGYDDFANTGAKRDGVMSRLNRSIHNYPVEYRPGRHFGGSYRTNTNPMDKSFDDLVIFYYGWIDAGEQGLARKLQIRHKVRESNTTHHHRRSTFERAYKHNQTISRDLSNKISSILAHHRRCTNQEW